MESPFFIVGCGRSGTTLLRSMLNHHPLLAIPPESIFIVDYLKAAKTVPFDTIKDLVIREPELKDWNIIVTKEELNKCHDIREVIELLHQTYLKKEHKKYWGQKTPRFIRSWELLKKFYPQAKFVHIIRDPRAVANSLSKSNVHNSNPYFATKRWLLDVSQGIKLKNTHPKDTLEIYYEELIRKPHKTLNLICKHIGIHFDNAMLEYHQKGSQEYTNYHKKIHKQLNSKPNVERINAWNEELSTNEIALIESMTKSFMKRFGYKSIKIHKTDRFIVYKMKVDRFLGLAKQVFRYLTLRREFFKYSIYRKYKLGTLFSDIKQINY